MRRISAHDRGLPLRVYTDLALLDLRGAVDRLPLPGTTMGARGRDGGAGVESPAEQGRGRVTRASFPGFTLARRDGLQPDARTRHSPPEIQSLGPRRGAGRSHRCSVGGVAIETE
jgi:hypothetical protein